APDARHAPPARRIDDGGPLGERAAQLQLIPPSAVRAAAAAPATRATWPRSAGRCVDSTIPLPSPSASATARDRGAPLAAVGDVSRAGPDRAEGRHCGRVA